MRRPLGNRVSGNLEGSRPALGCQGQGRGTGVCSGDGAVLGIRVSYLSLLTQVKTSRAWEAQVSTRAAVNTHLSSHKGGRDRGLRCPPTGQAGRGDCQRDQASRKHLLRASVCRGPENCPGTCPQVLQTTRKTPTGCVFHSEGACDEGVSVQPPVLTWEPLLPLPTPL